MAFFPSKSILDLKKAESVSFLLFLRQELCFNGDGGLMAALKAYGATPTSFALEDCGRIAATAAYSTYSSTKPVVAPTPSVPQALSLAKMLAQR